jgi:hypothetical protein
VRQEDDKAHVWDTTRDVCLRCGRTAKEIIDLQLKCEINAAWKTTPNN